jgi:5-methylcytosine-specific restriction endonuclease McrA
VPARWLRRQRGCGILSAEVVTAPTDRDTTRPAPDETGRAALEAGPAPGGDASAGRAAGLAADAAEHAGPEPVSAPETTSPRGVEPRALTDLSAARVLILNASYEPLHVCSVKRAVNLLMHEVVERVEDSERVLRTPSILFPVPSVVRLRRYVRRPHRQRVAFNRRNVFRRDDQRCQYCGGRSHDLTLDHVVPRSRGGPTSWENVVACCRGCNARKRDRTPEEARMRLIRQPRAPVFLFTAAYGIVPDVDPTWEKYLPVKR